MNCPHCLQQVPEGSAFCPYCGAKINESAPGALPEAMEDPTYGALAHANLLRLRGDWDAARERTVAVLREFPNSGTAHSLMGDIFADQGLDEDAAQWYRMALELEPHNIADQRKLSAAEARIAEHDTAKAEKPADEDAPPAFSGFRVAAWAAGAFLILIIALGLWVNRTTPRSEGEPPVAPRVTQPPPTVDPSGEPTVPGQPTTPEAPANPAAPEAPGAAEAPTGSAPAVATEPDETQDEATLRARLAPLEPTLKRAGLALADLQIDPRTETLIVTLDGAGVNGTSTDWMETAYRAALYVPARAFQMDRNLNHARVRIVMPLAARSGVSRGVAFIGEVTRPPGFDAVNNGMVTSLPGFDRRWWHPGLTPPSGITATP